MQFNSNPHHRKSIRLRSYDYAHPGAYFITLCTHQRQPLFGDIVDGVMVLTAAGMAVETCWRSIPDHFPWIRVDEFVVMPNYFHGIVHILPGSPNNISTANHIPLVGAPLAAPLAEPPHFNHIPSPNYAITQNSIAPENNGVDQGNRLQGAASGAPTVATILRRFKSVSAIAVNRCLGRQGNTVWQRNYYEHIIRDERAYLHIAGYIRTNPQKWHEDRYFIQ